MGGWEATSALFGLDLLRGIDREIGRVGMVKMEGEGEREREIECTRAAEEYITAPTYYVLYTHIEAWMNYYHYYYYYY